jgi:hypothetical protein
VAAAPILMASPVRRGQEAGGGGKGHNMISFLGWVAWTKESEKGGVAGPFKKVAHRCETEGGSAQRQRATMARARRPRAGGCR